MYTYMIYAVIFVVEMWLLCYVLRTLYQTPEHVGKMPIFTIKKSQFPFKVWCIGVPIYLPTKYRNFAQSPFKPITYTKYMLSFYFQMVELFPLQLESITAMLQLISPSRYTPQAISYCHAPVDISSTVHTTRHWLLSCSCGHLLQGTHYAIDDCHASVEPCHWPLQELHTWVKKELDIHGLYPLLY